MQIGNPTRVIELLVPIDLRMRASGVELDRDSPTIRITPGRRRSLPGAILKGESVATVTVGNGKRLRYGLKGSTWIASSFRKPELYLG